MGVVSLSLSLSLSHHTVRGAHKPGHDTEALHKSESLCSTSLNKSSLRVQEQLHDEGPQHIQCPRPEQCSLATLFAFSSSRLV